MRKIFTSILAIMVMAAVGAMATLGSIAVAPVAPVFSATRTAGKRLFAYCRQSFESSFHRARDALPMYIQVANAIIDSNPFLSRLARAQLGALSMNSVLTIIIVLLVAFSVAPTMVTEAAELYQHPNLTYFGAAQAMIALSIMFLFLGLGWAAYRKFFSGGSDFGGGM